MLALTAYFKGIYRCLGRAFQIRAALMTWRVGFISVNFRCPKARHLIQDKSSRFLL